MFISRPALARIAPFALFMAFLAVQGALGASLDDSTQRWLTALRGLAAASLLAFFWRDYRELRESARAAPGQWLLAVATGLAVFLVWITFDHGWALIGHGGARAFVPLDAAGEVDVTLVALRLFGLVAVVPLMEELFWRSFLMRWIDARDFLAADPRRTSWRAFALSCALFASEHSLWFAGLVAGAAYAWLYRRSGDLRIPIVSHAVTNGTLAIWILSTGNWSYW